MENHTFEIKGRFYKGNCLPGLNDLLKSAEKHPNEYNSIKRKMEHIVMNCIRRDLKGWKPKHLISLDITWGEKKDGQVRDYDNVVSAGRKIINDALVNSGTIEDDNPRYLMYGRNKFVYAKEPFVRVEIKEIVNDTKRSNNTVH